MKLFKRLFPILLSFIFVFNAFALSTSNWTWGKVTSISNQTVAPETTYSKISVSSPIGPHSINAIEFNPKNENLAMRAGLSNGEIYGNQTVAGMANAFNKLGEGQVIAAINADYFTFGKGVPFGIFMDGGEILSTPPQYSVSFGIKKDGTPFCQSHGTILNKTLVIGEKGIQLTAINCLHAKDANSLILYNSLFDESTRSAKDSVEVVLSHVSGEFRHGETVSLVVDQIVSQGGNTKIPDGKMVLSAQGSYKSTLLALTKGQKLSVKISFNEFWSDVDFAIAGNYMLLKNGVVQNVSGTERTARTVIGVKPNGNVIFYTIDGKMSDFSVGATYKQAATIMKDLGCVDAINLDGGGSTTFAMRYLGTNDVKMVNRSTESARAVANAALLVNIAPVSAPTKLFLASAPSKMLIGYKHKFSIAGSIDDNYLAYDLKTPAKWVVNNAIGSIASDGTFTALNAGKTRVLATVGNISAETYCTVVSSVNSITASNKLTVKPEQIIDIPVTLMHDGVSVAFSNELLSWQVQGDIGSFVSPGKFKAAKYKNSGKIIIRYGTAVKEIAVTVDGPTPEDFETFKDMGTHRWAKDALYRLYDAGIVKGVSANAFAPGKDLKRADFMLMLLRLLNVKTDTVVIDQFEDVPLNSYYYFELATAKRLGIAHGISDTKFAPERSITRQEMFTLTWRALKIAEKNDPAALSSFIDKLQIAAYAKPAVTTLVSLGLIEGDNNGRLNPLNKASRAESAVFLDRVYTYLKGVR